ncbi:MAG: MFS transporter [Chloroflexi bacterium]|nr:MFS transporter [Chloroflexota bacterium]
MKDKGIRTFIIMWFGQLVSIIGTTMTRFALIIWAYQQTGSATTLALMGFFAFGSTVLVSPLAGGLVDQWDRRKVLMVSDTLMGLVSVGVLLLYTTDQLQIWHLYVAEILVGGLDAFYRPVYSTAITVLVPEKFYTRANGMRSLSLSISDVIGPVFAGAMLAVIDIGGIMLIDVGTFLFAVSLMFYVHIPNPKEEGEDEEVGQHFWQKFVSGLRYIRNHEGLMGLLVVMLVINLFAALTWFAVMPAMVLARSGNNEVALATVQAAMGVGGIIGSLLMSIWGGPKRRIHNVLAATGLSFLLGDLLFGIGRTVVVWSLGGFLGSLFIPFIVAGNMALWQSHVPLKIQGRVFAAQTAVRTATMPVGYLLGGLLADYLFEPSMASGGVFAGQLDWLVGTGPGAGMGLMFVFTGLFGSAVGWGGYLIRGLRTIDDDLEPELIEMPAYVTT